MKVVPSPITTLPSPVSRGVCSQSGNISVNFTARVGDKRGESFHAVDGRFFGECIYLAIREDYSGNGGAHLGDLPLVGQNCCKQGIVRLYLLVDFCADKSDLARKVMFIMLSDPSE